MKWESPRGPVEIDPETRDIILTVYIQKVDEDRRWLAQRGNRQVRKRQGPGEGADEISAAASTLKATTRQVDTGMGPAMLQAKPSAKP
jgi:hypothetical protein